MIKFFGLHKKRILKVVSVLVAFSIWISWDIYQANQQFDYNYKPFHLNSEMNWKTSASTNVAIIRSDNTGLANPSSATVDPSYQTVEQMVRKAISLAGGFYTKIKSGMTVLIKPNLVEVNQPSGSGTDTDVRVVEAVARIVDEIDHGKIKIIVGDGSPRPFTTFEKNAASGKSPWIQLYGNSDPAKDAGYQKLLTRMQSAGINFRLSNLNGNDDTNPWNELKEVNIPTGGVAQPQKGKYLIHQDVLNADVYITVPVMKIHDPGITCALKNQIGLAPSSMYGFSKTAGVQQNNFQTKLLHTAQAPIMWTDKEIVDLSTIAKIKYVIVDALMCLDVQKTTLADKSNQVRMNLIVAGEDPVAVDNVCARVMGLNPDDIEHITLAERTGLGTNNIDNIKIVGENLASVKKRFRKNTLIPDQVFGQGNREWILSSPFSIGSVSSPIDYEYITGEATVMPKAGVNGWSQSTYFINDRIDLKSFYNSSGSSMVGYAFTYFTSPKDQEAELWLGSDEPLKVYLNGETVYNYNGTRTFTGATLLSEIKKINIKKGINSVLVKAIQKTGTFDFCLNICDVESNVSYRGNRVEGLKFITDASLVNIQKEKNDIPEDFALLNSYPNPFNSSIQIPFMVKTNENASVEIYNLLGEKIKSIYNGRTGTNSVRTAYWDGKDESNHPVSSGTYLVVLRISGNKFTSNKIVLLK